MLTNSLSTNAMSYARRPSHLAQGVAPTIIERPAGSRHDKWSGSIQIYHPDTHYHRSSMEVVDPIVKISPPDIANRRTATFPGITTEIVETTRCDRMEFRFHAPVVRLNSGKSPAKPYVRGGLAAWQQRAVVAYIEDRLAESISLATLAQRARLSSYHFCRAFKKSFGMPPHRYHKSRRLERAKSLLVKPAASITDIGLAVGFSEASSFTAAFRKATGLTPSSYRRSIG